MKSYELNVSKITLSEIQTLKKASCSEQEHKRYFAIELLYKNEDRSTINRILDLSVNTLSRWIKIVNEKGLESLKTQAGRGLKSRLTKEQKDEIKKAVLQNPRSLGYKESNWNARLLIRRIKQRYGVEYKQANIYVILKELGISYQRPTRLYGESSQEAQEMFKKNPKNNERKPTDYFSCTR